MKNLLIYINPSHDFGVEEKVTVKIQIDNSLNLGWKKDDILLVTNFPYEYNGIKALVVGDENYCDSCPATSKITTIVDLFKKEFVQKGKLYWYHDLDVFQNEVITEKEVEAEMGTADLGLTDKGRMPRWNGGSLFFKQGSKDIFIQAKEICDKYDTTDEAALMVLYTNNLLWVIEPEPEVAIGDRIIPANIPGMENVGKRIKKINISYNFRGWNIRSTYEMAVKPIRAVQFHPFDPTPYPESPNALEFFMYGKNKINTVLLPERLVRIFHKHGIR